jgi:hypothetical protein
MTVRQCLAAQRLIRMGWDEKFSEYIRHGETRSWSVLLPCHTLKISSLICNVTQEPITGQTENNNTTTDCTMVWSGPNTCRTDEMGDEPGNGVNEFMVDSGRGRCVLGPCRCWINYGFRVFPVLGNLFLPVVRRQRIICPSDSIIFPSNFAHSRS